MRAWQCAHSVNGVAVDVAGNEVDVATVNIDSSSLCVASEPSEVHGVDGPMCVWQSAHICSCSVVVYVAGVELEVDITTPHIDSSSL